MDARDRSREARFAELFETNYGRIRSYTSRRLPAHAALDATAETFLAAWRNFDRLRGDPLLWLYGLARGAVANQRRSIERTRQLQRRAAHLVQRPSEAETSDSESLEDPLLGALFRLSPNEREALCLIAWEGLSSEEAAVVAGCSPAAFKVRLFRARRRMRRLLQEKCETASVASLVCRGARSGVPIVAFPAAGEDSP